MKVLVTGATGFVGRALCEAALREGIEIRRLARGGGNADAAGETVRGSVLDPASLAGAFQGCDAVIHLVGIIAECGVQTFEAVHVGGTRNVIAAARAAGISRFVHMGALGARPGAAARYHRSKWAAEELVRESGLAWTIFRPSVIYGPGDGFVNFFEKISRWSPFVPVIGDGSGLLQPIAVEDVARCFAVAVKSSETVGRTFDLCGTERFRFVQVLDEILSAKKRRRLRLHIPRPVARLQARFLELICPAVFRQAPPLNRDQIIMLGEDNVGDPEPAMRAFRFDPRKFREGIRRFL